MTDRERGKREEIGEEVGEEAGVAQEGREWPGKGWEGQVRGQAGASQGPILPRHPFTFPHLSIYFIVYFPFTRRGRGQLAYRATLITALSLFPKIRTPLGKLVSFP